MKFTGETEVLGEKTCPSATFSTSNPKWIDPGSKPVLRGERPATNRLSHDTAHELGLELANGICQLFVSHNDTVLCGCL
jgi:hypothetical protein